MKHRTEAQIRADIAPLQKELHDIEDRKKRAEHKKLLGKCFKYRNSYGQGYEWWLYIKVIGSDGYWPEVFSFQETSMGITEIKPKDMSAVSNKTHIPITQQEFNVAWENMQKKIMGYKP